MRKRAYIVFLILFAASVHADPIGINPQIEYPVPAADNGELLVDFDNSESASSVSSFLSRIGFKSSQFSWFSEEEKWVKVRNVTSSLLQRIKGNSSVEVVEPNYYMSALYVPNDPYYKHQWHLDIIGMRRAWDIPRGGDVIVAVIDTGIAFEKFQDRFRAEDLSDSQFVKPYNFLRGDSHANDDHGHGTHVAGTIAQLTNNNIGVAGVGPNIKLMPLKVLTSRGFGTISDIAAAIRYAADNGAKVINMSLGGPFPSFILHKAIRYAHSKGVVIVCAAGNSGRSGLSYPAAYSECISVSAIRFDKTLAWYSSYGKGLTIAAPGGDTNVDQNGDGLMDGVLQNTLNPQDSLQQGYFLFQGTSMATPHVAAVAALLVSHGVTDPEKVRNYLKNSAEKVESHSVEKYGAGVLNASSALRSVFYIRRSKLLLLAVILFVLFISTINRRANRLQKISFGWLTLAGLLLGSTGFYFLGLIPHLPDSIFVTNPVPDWLQLTSAGHILGPVALSAVPALVVLLLLYASKRLVAVSIGFSIGIAAFLLFQIFSPLVNVPWVPGRLLEVLWLSLNALVSLLLATAAAFRLR